MEVHFEAKLIQFYLKRFTFYNLKLPVSSLTRIKSIYRDGNSSLIFSLPFKLANKEKVIDL